MRRALVLVVALLAALLPASPALAAPHAERYAFVDRAGAGGVDYVDIEGIQIVICKPCAFWILMQDKAGNPQVEVQVLGGLQNVAQAQHAANPDVAARYMATAIEKFSVAARLAGPDGVRVGGVGIFDLRRGTADPQPNPWLAAAGQHLANGVNLLYRAAVEGDPHPWVAAAITEFNLAYRELAEKRG